ncbi:prepilin-type N-terminal cleavage/methylation domain-containing protein [Legionella taurinensis]|uniref:Prepilin-type N-terminal cleavage/methylation domain-containing protein n=1 Tax=Legionella taurinensis TaxID=70611 RepID=A0A3A5LC31_9GAMM|nr:prepilin-type N-terminal cleavage/methylation domain-containing protein [Legionella taurinensis]MDX1837317.1 prepilin-type N-terminal cleavage/methylation domain-containing protein [Legionella taurinensis]PUT40673.1 hypothetical protein DB744_05230 [Legionella taurinensis]PUT44095.1 hypothetical protein DB746_03630 [Legionella taurinensis]PUT47396.1 hypothetical protein DB743_01800 [Legionella taurinensis]PUT48535.1 hypothetical protein DB745_03630 [Legionella taurinensis]
MTRQTGFSLVEIMIGLLLGSILLGALFNHYFMTRRHEASFQQQVTASDDVQMIIDLLQDNIRQAGFTPCAGIGWLTAADRRGKRQSLAAITLSGGTENRLAVKRMSEDFTAVNRILSPSQVLVDTGCRLSPRQVIMIADCFHAEVTTIERMKAQGESQCELTLKDPLQFPYTPPAYVGEWLEEQFFVQKNQTGEPALFYQSRHAEELSAVVRSFFARLHAGTKGQVLTVTLGLADNQQRIVNALVRIP